MAARRCTAVLMLAAVLAMHGLQCTPAVAGPVPAATAAASPEAAHVPTAATPAHHATTAGLPSLPAPDDTAHHVWTLCLAVLSAALTVVLAVLLLRPVTQVLPPPGRFRLHASRARAPAPPPDLSTLCLLRI